MNFATFLAAIWIVLPVCGFLPLLAALLDTEKVPNPTKDTLPPFFNAEVTLPVKDSKAALAATLEIPASAAIASIKSDLFIIKEEGLEQRQEAARHADALIREALDDWQREIRGYRAVDTIKQLRDGTQDLSEQELARALKALGSGKPAADVLTQLSRNLTNKFLHAPTVALRSAAEQGDLSLLDATHRLFSIDETEDSD